MTTDLDTLSGAVIAACAALVRATTDDDGRTVLACSEDDAKALCCRARREYDDLIRRVREAEAERVFDRATLGWTEAERDTARSERDATLAKLGEIRDAVTEFGGVHVCEGGGPEDVAASVAVSFAKLQRERDRRPEITPEDAKAWLSGNDDDSDVADALRAHAGKAAG
jgi:hypothetical protein